MCNPVVLFAVCNWPKFTWQIYLRCVSIRVRFDRCQRARRARRVIVVSVTLSENAKLKGQFFWYVTPCSQRASVFGSSCFHSQDQVWNSGNSLAVHMASQSRNFEYTAWTLWDAETLQIILDYTLEMTAVCSPKLGAPAWLHGFTLHEPVLCWPLAAGKRYWDSQRVAQYTAYVGAVEMYCLKHSAPICVERQRNVMESCVELSIVLRTQALMILCGTVHSSANTGTDDTVWNCP